MRVIDMTLTDNLNLAPAFCTACRINAKCHRGGDLEHLNDGVCDQDHDKLELAPMMPMKTENCDWEGTWEEWVAAYRTWKKFQENLEGNLRVEGLYESDVQSIKEAIDDCEVVAAREVHGNYSIFVASKGADPGPEIFAWLDESGELQAAENLDESEIERDISPEYVDAYVAAQGKQGPHDEPWGIE